MTVSSCMSLSILLIADPLLVYKDHGRSKPCYAFFISMLHLKRKGRIFINGMLKHSKGRVLYGEVLVGDIAMLD
jgi:hypothetical protein